MNLWFRLLSIVLGSLVRRRLTYEEQSILLFRVMPHDLDLNVHMNNARYLALMDLGRIDFLLRSGLWRRVRKLGGHAVVGGLLVRFRRPLAPFQAVTLTTECVYWDEKWVYFSHQMKSAGRLVCLTVARTAFIRDGIVLPPHEVIPKEISSRSVPDWITQWSDLDGSFAGQLA